MMRALLRDSGRAERVLATGLSVRVSPRRGVMLRDTKCAGHGTHGRSELLVASFPDLSVWRLPGARFYPLAGNAVVAKDTLYLDGSISVSLDRKYFESISSAQEAALAAPVERSVVELHGPVFLACNEGSGTWGHWVIHTLPRVLMFLDIFPDGRVIVPAAYFGSLSSFGDLLQVFGVKERAIPVSGDVEVRIEDLIFVDLPYKDGLPHPIALDLLRSLRGQVAGANRGLFFNRTNAKKRNIENIEEVGALVGEHGVVPVDNGRLALDDQMTLWGSSLAATGVLGSDFTNMVFGVQRVLSLTPAWFGDYFFYGLAASLGIEWNEVQCGAVGETRSPLHASSFYVEPGVLREALSHVYRDLPFLHD